MQRKARYFDSRSGRELTESEALRGGIMRDGVTMRTRMMARDHAQHFRDGRALFDSGQVAITDGDGTLRTANGPGWRCADSPINRQAVHDARARYLSDLESAYKNPSTGFGEQGAIGQRAGDLCTINGQAGHSRMVNGMLQCVPDRADAAPDEARRECPDCDGEGEIDGKQCPRCKGSGEIVDDPDDAEEVSDDDDRGRPPFGSQDRRRTVDQIAHDHRMRMERIYQDHAQWLSEQWKTK